MLDPVISKYLFNLHRRGIKVGLHRTEALLEKCGNPHDNIPVIHIAGTNGKGSTSAMIASILRQTGKSVGLYTSPHLVNFNERIRINGRPIRNDDIATFLARHRPSIDLLESTFFETTTAMTFSYFVQNKVDIAVIEVGLGGRLDSTNVSKSILSVLTPIHFDHMEFLGHDLDSITHEKCGIIKRNTPVVMATQLPEVENIIFSVASHKKAPFIKSSATVRLKKIELKDKGTSFIYDGQQMRMPLMGGHQITNAQTAIAVIKTLDHEISKEEISNALAKLNWPGRLQKINERPPVFYDVAHNAHGLKATLQTLRELFPQSDINAICAIKKSKGLGDIARLLKLHCQDIITTSPDEVGFWTANNLALEMGKYGINTTPVRSVSRALNCCFAKPDSNILWLIFGTHFIAKHVYNKFGFPFDNGII